MKAKTTKERRQINIPKEDYNTIKNFCNKNSLDMPKWIVMKLLEIIKEDDITNLDTFI